MKRLREVQLALLEEIDQVCRRHGIPYILTGRTAHAATTRHELPAQVAIPTIAMTYKDACRVRVLLDIPNREFEDFLQNRNIDKAVFRYSNSSTFLGMAEDMGSFRSQGICVDIELIRGVPNQHLVARLLVALDAAGVICARLRNTARWSKLIWTILGVIERRFFRMVYCSRRLLRLPYLRISRFPSKSINFPRAFLLERKEISVCGRSFFVPKDLEDYMKLEWGFDWEKAPCHDQGNLHLSVWDCNTPYAVFSDFATSKVQIHWIRWFLLKARLRRLRRQIEGYWSILLYVRDYFSMSRLYIPQKEELLRQYSSSGIAAIMPQLTDYLNAIERQMASGLGLYFDEQLFALALEVLTRQYGKGYAERVRAAVPSAFSHYMNAEEKCDD